MATWQCVTECGACCNLDPVDYPNLEDYLTLDEITHYFSLVGKGRWCINFDHDTRKCRIYQKRPDFCRVTPHTFEKMYKIERTEFNDFAIECCQQQIAGVYGENSLEMEHYKQEVVVDRKTRSE
ncbi:YkgJ family cysteine cluster protein [cyanobacterium endosymbiont of Epithemia clementina EcSB]|uniref:YkgJ family cysteine cluster protein n=1 Tax=cyanobacterium endosymbiont of Epithemia clementina EcSB TaxID=3034674 RepID=UPI00247FA5EE|nr:YkgJ family cysteine cluster protein [cyanobacterium endosymbiont of Epithemia clementina EcSB]WGT67565.1 YkgJ family cysteine cluster protein [cyanobacterium endosymbiont of Epithemia clementina EcSB]